MSLKHSGIYMYIWIFLPYYNGTTKNAIVGGCTRLSQAKQIWVP